MNLEDFFEETMDRLIVMRLEQDIELVAEVGDDPQLLDALKRVVKFLGGKCE
jgi:hypothetical protein